MCESQHEKLQLLGHQDRYWQRINSKPWDFWVFIQWISPLMGVTIFRLRHHISRMVWGGRGLGANSITCQLVYIGQSQPQQPELCTSAEIRIWGWAAAQINFTWPVARWFWQVLFLWLAVEQSNWMPQKKLVCVIYIYIPMIYAHIRVCIYTHIYIHRHIAVY